MWEELNNIKKELERENLRCDFYAYSCAIYSGLINKVLKKEINEEQLKNLSNETKEIILSVKDGHESYTIEHFHERIKLLKEFKSLNNL
jgi:hypothetical protein